MENTISLHFKVLRFEALGPRIKQDPSSERSQIFRLHLCSFAQSSTETPGVRSG